MPPRVTKKGEVDKRTCGAARARLSAMLAESRALHAPHSPDVVAPVDPSPASVPPCAEVEKAEAPLRAAICAEVEDEWPIFDLCEPVQPLTKKHADSRMQFVAGPEQMVPTKTAIKKMLKKQAKKLARKNKVAEPEVVAVVAGAVAPEPLPPVVKIPYRSAAVQRHYDSISKAYGNEHPANILLSRNFRR